MSYILEALKKADQQRELGNVPGIDASHESGQRTNSRLPWIIAAVLLIGILILLAALLWPEGRVDDGRPPPLATVPGTEPQVLLRRVEPTPTVAPQQRQLEPIPAVVPQQRQLKPIPVPVPAPAKVVEPEPVPMEIDPVAARLALARSLLPSDLDDGPMETQVKPEAAERIAEQPVVPESRAREPDLPVWPQIPQNLFGQLSGGLRLDVHVFTDLPENRFVLINMRKYYEGQRLQEGPVLDEITPEGVILSFNGQRFRVQAQ